MADWTDKFKNGQIPDEVDFGNLIALAESSSNLGINQYISGGGGVIKLLPDITPFTIPSGTFGESLLATTSAQSAKDLLNIINITPSFLPLTSVISTTDSFTPPPEAAITTAPKNQWLPSERGIEILADSFQPSGNFSKIIITAKISFNTISQYNSEQVPTEQVSFSMFCNDNLIDYVSVTVSIGGYNSPIDYRSAVLEAVITLSSLQDLQISIRAASEVGGGYQVNGGYGSSSLIIRESN